MRDAITITTFYNFTPLADPARLRQPILERMRTLDIRGTITLAGEGINATLSGTAEALDMLMAALHETLHFTTPSFRESYYTTRPFRRTKVKVKRELISLGVPAHPGQCVGIYVPPKEWNALITAPDVTLIDTRNDYEYALGHFAGAINPATRHFKQMVAWTQHHLPPPPGGRIAMYCTGGIRCDKYSSYLVASGYPEVYHLQGGILAYLEHIPEAQSLWQGSCFVFDERVAVGHGLQPAPAPMEPAP